jgi:hypothetical protein
LRTNADIPESVQIGHTPSMTLTDPVGRHENLSISRIICDQGDI